jgi:hypothetical protein
MTKRPKSHGDKKQKDQDRKQQKKVAASEVATAALGRLPARAPAERPALQKAAVPQRVSGPAKPGFEAVATIEGSLQAAGQGAVAVNRKLIDIAQANLHSGLEHVKNLAGAKTPMAMMRLQMEYWHERVGVFTRQAEELRELQAQVLGNAAAPIREHARKSAAA